MFNAKVIKCVKMDDGIKAHFQSSCDIYALYCKLSYLASFIKLSWKLCFAS